MLQQHMLKKINPVLVLDKLANAKNESEVKRLTRRALNAIENYNRLEDVVLPEEYKNCDMPFVQKQCKEKLRKHVLRKALKWHMLQVMHSVLKDVTDSENKQDMKSAYKKAAKVFRKYKHPKYLLSICKHYNMVSFQKELKQQFKRQFRARLEHAKKPLTKLTRITEVFERNKKSLVGSVRRRMRDFGLSRSSAVEVVVNEKVVLDLFVDRNFLKTNPLYESYLSEVRDELGKQVELDAVNDPNRDLGPAGFSDLDLEPLEENEKATLELGYESDSSNGSNASILFTSASIPSISASIPSISASIPSISASILFTSASIPSISASIPSISASIPSISASIPSTSASIPSISASIPSTSTSTLEALDNALRRGQQASKYPGGFLMSQKPKPATMAGEKEKKAVVSSQEFSGLSSK